MKVKYLFAALLMIVSFGAFAITQDDSGFQIGEAGQLVTWLMPVIVWLATQATKLLVKIPGFILISVVVPGISLGLSFLVTSMDGSEMSWIMTFLYGLGATFLDQLKRKIQEKNNS